MMQKSRYLVFFLVSLLSAGTPGSFLTFLPEKKFVPSFTASGTEHRISYNKLLTRRLFFGSMGGIFPVADIQYDDLVCQVSAASSIYTTLQNAGRKYKVTDVNFYVDIFFDILVTPETVLRTGWGHTSHHLADDALAPGVTAVNYARDYYELFVVRQFPAINGFAYGGLHWTYSFLINRNIGRKILPEFGGEGTILKLSDAVVMYAAADFKFHGELEYGSTQSYQVGFKSQNVNLRAVRLAYTFRTGIEERGQFYDQRNIFHTVGVFFDF